MGEIDMVTFLLVKFVLNVGPLGIALLLAAWSAGCGYAGYVVGGSGRKERPKKPTRELQEYFAPKERPMEAQKFEHVKTDILPDGTLSPGDNRNLEGPE
jgi:hypothetical protein